ncbi:MAG: thiamine pyrophosphate-dependent enzyme [bacterium]|nr:thiamine pyrophosphate-dependent enzyme [bacterium]
MFGNNMIIANATGCSSIYGGSINTPYNIPWTNSLFEDNAEYGLGIAIANKTLREKVKKLMTSHIDKVDSKTATLFNKWLNNYDDDKITNDIYKKINYNKIAFLKPFKDYIKNNSVWIIGGDGFAYDIGFSGIDHVLSSNENINILILDTEVYSNTGGQSSKSSNIGSIASFTQNGKTTYKKDLAKIALAYPHVYVATTNIGYNKSQYLKVLTEAKNYNGPSIIIAYSPCIEHGIIDGMENSLTNAHLATLCGYFPIFRYNPNTKEFILDSKDIDFTLYGKFLKTQNRYARLANIDKATAKDLLNKNQKWAKERYNYYLSLERKENDKNE